MVDDPDALEDIDEEPDEELVDVDEELEEDLEEELDDAIEDEVAFVEDEEVADDAEDEDEDEESDDETLDELGAEELELVDDEASESLLVDEVAELRQIRREELTLNVDAQAVRAGEFVCQSCFLVKRMSQLADKKKLLCLDCAS